MKTIEHNRIHTFGQCSLQRKILGIYHSAQSPNKLKKTRLVNTFPSKSYWQIKHRNIGTLMLIPFCLCHQTKFISIELRPQLTLHNYMWTIELTENCYKNFTRCSLFYDWKPRIILPNTICYILCVCLYQNTLTYPTLIRICTQSHFDCKGTD